MLRFGMQDAIRHIENHILSACMYIHIYASEVPSFASPDDVTLGQSGPFYLEFNEVHDICVITCYIIIMQHLAKSATQQKKFFRLFLFFICKLGWPDVCRPNRP